MSGLQIKDKKMKQKYWPDKKCKQKYTSYFCQAFFVSNTDTDKNISITFLVVLLLNQTLTKNVKHLKQKYDLKQKMLCIFCQVFVSEALCS